jgi:hypothetical protein
LKRSREWLEGKTCALHDREGLFHFAEEVHHAKGRIGALLLDERFWVPLCSAGHQWVTEHPIEAQRLGLSVSRLSVEAS